MSKTIKNMSIQHGIHLEKIDNVRPDATIVKLLKEYEDGTIDRELKVITNFKRDIYVTKEHFRNHNEKKEYEDMSKLDKISCTTSDIPRVVGAKLNHPNPQRLTLRDIKKKPYVYGVEVSPVTILKKGLMDKYPEESNPLLVAALDIEANVYTKEIYIMALAELDRCVVVYTDNLVKKLGNVMDLNKKLKDMYDKHIPEGKAKQNMKEVEFIKCGTEADAIKNIFKKAHEWQPDLVAIWNIDYDIPAIMERCDKWGLKHTDIFCDPNLPENLKHFKYKQGNLKKVMSSGKEMALSPEQRWHYAEASASFFLICAMSTYNFIRVGQKKVPSGYGINSIMKHEKLPMGKLRMIDTHLTGAEYHKFMVENHPLEYIIYCIWDTMGMNELDLITKDLRESLKVVTGMSNLHILNSGPNKIIDDFHFYLLNNNKVLGVKPDYNSVDHVLGMDGWTCVLEAYRVKNGKINYTTGVGNSTSNVVTHTSDIDVTAAYPSVTAVFNISKTTTKRELFSVEGFKKEVFKAQNINLLGGPTNALEYTQTMFKAPNLFELEEKIKNKIKK